MLRVMTVEIRLRRKYTDVHNGHQKSSAGNTGTSKHRGLVGEAKLEAARQTAKGAKVLMLVGARHRVLVPLHGKVPADLTLRREHDWARGKRLGDAVWVELP